MTLRLKLPNGSVITAQVINEADLAAAVKSKPAEFNQKQAASFMGISVPTFRNLMIPKNANGKWSRELLEQRITQTA